MNANPYQTYKQQSIMTMTPGEVLITVYDELVKQISFAQCGLETNDFEAINNSLKKSQRIIRELQNSLNHEYSIAENLNELYEYFNRVLINANVKKDGAELDEVKGMVVELRDSFRQADKLARG